MNVNFHQHTRGYVTSVTNIRYGGGEWIVVVPVSSSVEHSCYTETVWLVLQTYGGRGGG